MDILLFKLFKLPEIVLIFPEIVFIFPDIVLIFELIVLLDDVCDAFVITPATDKLSNVPLFAYIELLLLFFCG